MTVTIATLLAGLFVMLAAGAVLRRAAGMGQGDADTLNKLIVDVTMPALIFRVLVERELVWSAAAALIPSTTALLCAGAGALLWVRWRGGDCRTQGSAALTTGFANTGFLGFPLLLSLFPHDNSASSTALLIDTVDTTLLLWTLGLAVGQRLGHGAPFNARQALLVLLRPPTVALALGLVVGHADVALPAFLDQALLALGACTSPLVFLSLGLQLDVRVFRGRAVSLLGTVALKLLVAPLLCLLLVRALAVPEPVAAVAVLQCAMPSAMASVIVAAQTGCDRAFAAGAATLSTLLCLLTLPLVGSLLSP